MTNQSDQLADYAFKSLGLESTAEKVGMRPEAVDDLLLHIPEFSVMQGEDGVRTLIHAESGLSAFDYCNVNLRQIRPHYFPSAYDGSLADKAFLEPNLTAQGQLVKEIGLRDAEALAKKYNTRLGSDKKGTAPDDDSKPAPKPGSFNPFLKRNWSLARQGEIVKSLGPEKAAQIAKAAGCKLGDVRPNPAFN
jgi:hypothetical protein